MSAAFCLMLVLLPLASGPGGTQAFSEHGSIRGPDEIGPEYDCSGLLTNPARTGFIQIYHATSPGASSSRRPGRRRKFAKAFSGCARKIAERFCVLNCRCSSQINKSASPPIIRPAASDCTPSNGNSNGLGVRQGDESCRWL